MTSSWRCERLLLTFNACLPLGRGFVRRGPAVRPCAPGTRGRAGPGGAAFRERCL